MSLAELVQKEAPSSSAPRGASGLAGLLASSGPDITAKARQAARDAEAAQFESQAANSFGGILKNTLLETGSRLLNIVPNIIKGTKDTVVSSFENAKAAVQQGANEYQPVLNGQDVTARSALSLGKAGGRVAGDVATAIFAPLSASIGAVLKATGGQTLIDKGGKLIADSSGITDWPAFQKFAMSHPNAGEDFNRLLNLATLAQTSGGTDLPSKATELVNKVASDLTEPSRIAAGAKAVAEGQRVGLRSLAVDQQGPGVSRVPLNRGPEPMSIFSPEYAAKEGYQGYVPDNMLPEIQMGPKARTPGPTIQMNARGGKPNLPEGMTYEPVPQNTPAIKSPFQLDNVMSQPAPGAAPALETVAPKPLTSSESSPSKMALGVEARAVSDGLVKDLGSLPDFATTNWEHQAQRAVDITDKNFAQAKRIAMGLENPPSDVLPEAVFKAVEDVARKNGDVATLRDLGTKSALLGESRVMGQRIGYQSQFGEDSPVKAIKEVAKAREQAAGIKDVVKAKRETVTELKKELAKNRPTKQNWNDFIKEIQC